MDALKKANATCNKLAGSLRDAEAVRDQAKVALEKERTRKMKAEAEASDLRAELQATMAEIQQEREEKAAAKKKMEALEADVEATKKSLVHARVDVAERRDFQSRAKEWLKEYEMVMNDLVNEKEVGRASSEEFKKLREERDALRKELQTMIADLKATEIAFKSIHPKAQRLRETIEMYKANEKKLMAALDEARLKALVSETIVLDAVSDGVEEKLKLAAKGVKEAKKAREMETGTLKVKLRLTQTELSSARAAIVQKEGNAKELSQLAKELFKKVPYGQNLPSSPL